MAQTITIEGVELDAEDLLAAIEQADAGSPSESIMGSVGESGDVRVVGDSYTDRDVAVYDTSGAVPEKVIRHHDADHLITQAGEAIDTTTEPSDVSDTWMHAWTPSQDAYLPAEEADVSSSGMGFTMSRPEGVTMLSHDFPDDCFSGLTFSAKGVERIGPDEVPFDDVSDHFTVD